jgi:hypothetical protein
MAKTTRFQRQKREKGECERLVSSKFRELINLFGKEWTCIPAPPFAPPSGSK